MYIIEIFHKKTNRRAGPIWETGPDCEYTRITDAMLAAQRWLVKNKLPSGEYRIVPRIVGYL